MPHRIAHENCNMTMAKYAIDVSLSCNNMGTSSMIYVMEGEEKRIASLTSSDGYPEGVGVEILGFVSNRRNLEELESVIPRCKSLSQENIENFMRNDLEWENRFISEHPEYICHYGGTFLLKLISCDRDPIVWNRFGDRRLDDYAYVIDLERRTFEAYKGWNKTPVPQEERFYHGNEPSEIGYFPFREMGAFDLDNLPSFPEFINVCNHRREEFGDA